MEEQLVMALVSPKQLCRLICAIGGKVGKPQLPGHYLQEAQELGEEAKLQVYLGAS